MPTVSNGDVEIHYEDSGGSGRPVVLVHGWPLSGASWSDLTPALEAELFDGTGSVVLIWLGRREIPGIDTGRCVRVEGLVACSEGRKVMYNPSYELTAGSGL